MTAVTHPKSERIDVRAIGSVKQLLQEAARVVHKNHPLAPTGYILSVEAEANCYRQLASQAATEAS